LFDNCIYIVENLNFHPEEFGEFHPEEKPENEKPVEEIKPPEPPKEEVS
jgi:hypothetical protein